MPSKHKSGAQQRFQFAAGLVVAMLLLAIGLFNWQLRVSHGEERARVGADTEKRAAQLVGTVATRMAVLVRSADFAVQQLRRDYGVDDTRLRVTTDLLLVSFPPQSLLQLAVADAAGDLRYSRLAQAEPVNVGDRPHFKAHLAGGDQLFIGKPLQGRVSKAWEIPFSRPILRDGRFAGVAVVSLSPTYVSQVLATL